MRETILVAIMLLVLIVLCGAAGYLMAANKYYVDIEHTTDAADLWRCIQQGRAAEARMELMIEAMFGD